MGYSLGLRILDFDSNHLDGGLQCEARNLGLRILDLEWYSLGHWESTLCESTLLGYRFYDFGGLRSGGLLSLITDFGGLSSYRIRIWRCTYCVFWGSTF